MNVNYNNKLISRIMGIVQHYNPDKYWKMRECVVNQNNGYPRLIKYFFLLYIKRCDAFNCASMGTDMGSGAVFDSPPFWNMD